MHNNHRKKKEKCGGYGIRSMDVEYYNDTETCALVGLASAGGHVVNGWDR